MFPLEFNASLSSRTHEDGLTDNEVHKLSISRGFSFSESRDGSENLSSITKSSIVLTSSVRTGDSIGESDKQSFQLSNNSRSVNNPIVSGSSNNSNSHV